jgi:hypothetical protein
VLLFLKSPRFGARPGLLYNSSGRSSGREAKIPPSSADREPICEDDRSSRKVWRCVLALQSPRPREPPSGRNRAPNVASCTCGSKCRRGLSISYYRAARTRREPLRDVIKDLLTVVVPRRRSLRGTPRRVPKSEKEISPSRSPRSPRREPRHPLAGRRRHSPVGGLPGASTRRK